MEIVRMQMGQSNTNVTDSFLYYFPYYFSKINGPHIRVTKVKKQKTQAIGI